MSGDSLQVFGDQGSALVLKHVSKTFEGNRVLSRVDLEVRQGEVHALLGQNGSGKSTLIKILAGYHQPDRGAKAWKHGQPFELGSGDAASHAGIRFVHQDLGIVDELSVAENLALGEPYPSRFWASARSERAIARGLLNEYGLCVSPDAALHELSAAQRASVAIIRALRGGLEGGVLVLDEPTAALPASEVAHLFRLIDVLRRRRTAVLYVTHRLTEVLEIADRVTVLRDGHRVTTQAVNGLTHEDLVTLIIGRPLAEFYPTPPQPSEDVALKVTALGGSEVRELSFTAHAGEIVGITGLVGSGHERALHLIFGAETPVAGEVWASGITLRPPSPRSAIKAGLAFAPADRQRRGALMPWTVRENLTLPSLPARGPARWMNEGAEARDAASWLSRLDVTPADPERVFATLSGGNQQKVVLARWLRCGARVMLLEEPTNGVDTGAKRTVYASLTKMAAEGSAIVLSSSDAEELCLVCDRVLVMRSGRIATILHGESLSVERIAAETMAAVEASGSGGLGVLDA